MTKVIVFSVFRLYLYSNELNIILKKMKPNKRNIEILTAHLKRRFDNEPIDLVYYLYAIIYKQYNETPETNETEKMRLAEQVEAYMNYFNNR